MLGPATLPDDRPPGEPPPAEITLLLTTACNLRCSYCYASAGDGPAESMSFEIASRAIRFLAASARERGRSRISIAYHGGGEPTLNWAVLTGSAEYARRLSASAGLALSLSTATNGVLPADRLEWIVRNLDGASVSFDGLADVHDTARRFPDGHGTSGEVMRSLRFFDEAGFRYGIRMTVTAEQVCRLADSVEFICAHFRPETIQIEPVYLLGRAESEPPAEADEFIEQFRRARAAGRPVVFSGARIDCLTSHFCSATRDGFCVSPKGNITSCTEVFSEHDRLAHRFFYGRPAAGPDGYDFDAAVLSDLNGSSVRQREFCGDCFARWTCGGDCLHKVLQKAGDGPLEGAGRCRIIRELTKDLILEKIAASGGIFWNGEAARD